MVQVLPELEPALVLERVLGPELGQGLVLVLMLLVDRFHSIVLCNLNRMCR